MSSNDIAPYATAHTSVLVYRGKGILVKRANTRDDAIADAISEFGLQASPNQVYLTSYVGAQGQEVEISRSAFAYIKDTIPIHVHLREEDDSAERPRWPALPLAGFAPDPPKPEPPPQPALPLRLPYLFGLGRGDGSKTSESKVDSISDWQRNSAGTPDTGASVHRQQSKRDHTVQGQSITTGSPEEMLSERAMNSLINGYAANGNSFPESLPDGSQANSVPSNNAGKAWNWFKKASTALAAPVAANASAVMNNQAKPHEQPVHHHQTTGNRQLDVGLQAELPQRPSRDETQHHRPTLSKVHRAPVANVDTVSQEIETLLEQKQSLGMEDLPMETARLHVNKRKTQVAYDSVDEDDQWGPGGLVVEGASDADVSTVSQALPKSQPWWAKPAGVLDAKASKKLGLKPFALRDPEASNLGRKAPSASGPSQTGQQEAQTSEEAGRRASRIINKSRHAPKESGRVSPGAPLSGRRRRTASGKFSRDDSDSRPMPADMPESPFSARRFTRHDVNYEMGATRHKPSRSRMLPTDATDDLITDSETDQSITLQAPPAGPSRGLPATSKYEAPETRAAFVRAPSTANVGRQRATPASKVQLDRNKPASAPAPVVPVAARPPLRPLPSERSDSKGSGAFAAAASAARRKMTTRDQKGLSRNRQGDADSNASASTRREMVKRTSLSSLRDFVAAEIADENAQGEADKADEEEEEASTVQIERLVLGPMDLSSPNRKGSELVMKAKLESCQLSLEWVPERKVIVSVPFDAIRALQLPEPGSKESFLVIRPTTGEVRVILIEMNEENLLAFQRYVLVFIAGLGADVEHLSPAEFIKVSKANGW